MHNRVRFRPWLCLLMAIGVGYVLFRRVEQRSIVGVDSTSASLVAAGARDTPLRIRPVVGEVLPISQAEHEQLHREIVPPQNQKMTSSYCLHLLRVHGLDASFAFPDAPTGDAILRLLTDHGAGAAYFGEPAIIKTQSGLRFPSSGSSEYMGGEAHRDHTLAAFGELGIPLTYPLQIANGNGTLRDVLRDSIDNFHLRQSELAWTTLAYALYLPPQMRWKNRYGEVYTFDQLIDEILSRPLDRASCGGTHVLYTLAVVARADRAHPILSEATRTRVFQSLSDSLDVALQQQQLDGSWLPTWNHALLAGGAPDKWSIANTLEDRVVVTGHLAEWMLMLPEEMAVSRSTLQRAAQWMHHQLSSATVEVKEKQFCPYTHLACVLRQIAYVPEAAISDRPVADR